MRQGSNVLLLLLLLLPAIPACGEDEPPVDERRTLFEKAVLTLDEAREKLARKDPEGARIDLLRSEELALGALKARGEQPNVQVLNLLANICAEIGLLIRPYLIRAMRFATRAVDEAPNQAFSYFNLGVCFGALGFNLDAVRAYERVLGSDLPLDVRATAANNTSAMLLAEAKRVLTRGRPGAQAEARFLLERAYGLREEYGVLPGVDEAVASLGRYYEQATKEAIASGDPVEVAIAHAECGYFVPAREILDRVRTESGRTEELRWAEARYLLELEGSQESLEAAEKLYLEFIGRGERVAQALAGYARVSRGLGHPEDALARIEGFPDPTVELRELRIELLLDRVSSLPVGEKSTAEELYKRVDELLLGSFPEEDRADLLLKALLTAAHRDDADRLTKWVSEFHRRYPTDPRALLFEARLLDIRKIPLLPEEEGSSSGAAAGGKGGND